MQFLLLNSHRGVCSFVSVKINWEDETQKVRDHLYTEVTLSQDLTALPNKLL